MKHCMLKYALPLPEDPASMTSIIKARRDFNPLSVVIDHDSSTHQGMFVHGTCGIVDNKEEETCKHAFLIVPNGVEFSANYARFLGTVVLNNRIPVITFHIFYRDRAR